MGMVAERSRPASPRDNGRHEHMRRTLKEDTLARPARNPQCQQQALLAWRKVKNDERPHEAID